MKKARLITSILMPVLLILALVLPAAANGPIEPPEVNADLVPGGKMTVVKEVTTPTIPENADIYFMSDTTASMGPVIAAVQANAGTILTTIQTAQPSAQFGVGDYKDFPSDPYAFNNAAPIDGIPTALAAIGFWAAGGGYDYPEGQFYALDRLANGTGIGWRGGPNKIVVWFGDAPAHDPVPMIATGLGYDITEVTVTADLVNAGIKVIAISWDSGPGSPYPLGLDDDPNVAGGDYATAYSITEDGNPGQASRIAAATGGVYLFAATPQEAADAVLTGIEALTSDVWWEVIDAHSNLTVELDPSVHYAVPGGTTVLFDETITVSADAPQCNTIDATVVFYANSYPDREGAEIGRQEIAIHVLDTTPPEVSCEEAVNPHGKNVPPAGSTTEPGTNPKSGKNPDGFYQLFAEDNCDDSGDVGIFISGFGPFFDGDVVKLTEDPDILAAEMKMMGSSNGKAGAVVAHIIVPTEPMCWGVDTSGNESEHHPCYVPPPPK